MTPPPNETQRKWLPVGDLTRAFAENYGPQRDRPTDLKDYRKALRKRAERYGTFSWPALRDRVISSRANGELWPLEGNGSNHWIEDLFGPETLVPCILVFGLTREEENDLFQKLQVNKAVSPAEKYHSDKEFNIDSIAAKIQAALPQGYCIKQSASDPWAVGQTVAAWVADTYGLRGLTEVLNLVSTLYGPDESARTNGSIVKALAVLLYRAEEREMYDTEILFPLLKGMGAKNLANKKYGKDAYKEVLKAIRDLYGVANLWL